MEARVAKLEVAVEYIQRDITDLKSDVRTIKEDLHSIKNRMAYFAGAMVVAVAIFAWIANNRFDQILTLLTK